VRSTEVSAAGLSVEMGSTPIFSSWCLGRGLLLPAESTPGIRYICAQRDSDWNKAITGQFSLIAGAHRRLLFPYKERSMSNTPGAQAQASTQASRNSPSDIDELRDNAECRGYGESPV
jgi:hypothetical protein